MDLPDSMDYTVIKDLHVPWVLWIYLFPWIKNLLNSLDYGLTGFHGLLIYMHAKIDDNVLWIYLTLV